MFIFLVHGYPFNPCLTKENYTEIQDKVKGVFDQLKSAWWHLLSFGGND
ncbi:unnamed protein product [Meloidogyne enterolobii]|uniref:Uncharacterized protein n=1 Tax=Meloidogyne enterolobii TaxID=390850 RepID=A0ACB1AFG1_MELEN